MKKEHWKMIVGGAALGLIIIGLYEMHKQPEKPEVAPPPPPPASGGGAKTASADGDLGPVENNFYNAPKEKEQVVRKQYVVASSFTIPSTVRPGVPPDNVSFNKGDTINLRETVGANPMWRFQYRGSHFSVPVGSIPLTIASAQAQTIEDKGRGRLHPSDMSLTSFMRHI